MKTKKVVMVVSNPCTNDSRVLKEAQTLAENGYEVIIYAVKTGNTSAREKVQGFTIKRIPVAGYALIQKRFWRNLWYWPVAFIQLIGEKADVYHAHDADTLGISYLASRFAKTKLVYDFHEYWRKKTTYSKHPLKVFWERKIQGLEYLYVENALSPIANGLITVNQSLADEFIKDVGVDTVVILKNTPHYTEVDPQWKSLIRQQLGLNNSVKIVLYLGSLSKGRGIETLLKVSKAMSNDYAFVFIGYGHLTELVCQESLNHKNVFYIPAVAPSEVISWASGADVGISPIQNISWSYYYSSPNKVFEYIMAEVPVICSNFPEMRDLITTYSCGELLQDNSIEEFVNKIRLITEDKEKYMKGVLLAKQQENWEAQTPKLLALYEKFF